MSQKEKLAVVFVSSVSLARPPTPRPPGPARFDLPSLWSASHAPAPAQRMYMDIDIDSVNDSFNDIDNNIDINNILNF